MTGRSLKVNLVANTSQFKSAMSETSNQMKLINSEFKSAAAETDKYGNKLDQTGAKKKQLNGVIQQYTSRIKAITNEQKHWTSELEKGNITETEHAQKQQELARRLNNTEAEMKKYEGQLKKLNAEGKATRMTFDEFDKKFREVGTTMRNVGAQVGITAGVGFMAMKKVLGDVVKEASTFHAGMSEVQAISGATGDELGKLTNQAKDLGKATMFTSQQASESMANLARAGFSVSEIYDTMPGLLDLAASSKMELGAAADVTANILRTFNFDAKESGRVADILAKGAATANQDVAGLAKSMEIAGPVANSLNLSFESVAAATGIMADAGVDGSTAGRMLRQGMLRLAKPTGQAGKLLKKMGLEAFDADGNMKSLDKVVGELEKGLEGQTKQQKAAALATIFGSESTAGWTVLLDKGSGTLKDYTVDLENSEGAAKKMADVMQDNAEGSIIRMQSALSGLKIELGEKLLPFLAQGADFIGDLANKMSEWDEETITTIAHTALLVTAVLGVTTVVAGLVAGLGAFMMVAGPIGLAIAGGTLLLGGLAAAVYKSSLETENSNKVNLDNAKSLSEQAIELEKNADTFDKLSDKAKISNSELAQLHDLNQRIAQGGSSEEIAKLQHQYDKLAEKSGLSKEELEKLFGANDSLIKQSPDVEKSVSDQGNAFVENTDAVKEYIGTLYEMSRVELEAERVKKLEQEKVLRNELKALKVDEVDTEKELKQLLEWSKMTKDEMFDKQEELSALYYDDNKTQTEKNAIMDEYKTLQSVMNKDLADEIQLRQDSKAEIDKSIKSTEAKLAAVAALDSQMANILLKQAGITEEDEKGLIALENKLSKNHETLSNLDVELEKNGKLTEEQQAQYDSLIAQNEKLQEAQSYINKELELYGSVNSLVESQKHLLSEGTQEKIKSLEQTLGIEVAEGNILAQIQEKNTKLAEERAQLEINRELQGANKEEIDKQIAAIDGKINAGDGVILQMLKELDILELVRDGILLNGTELQAYLEGLGYSTDEAFKLAQQLSGETVKALEEGVDGAEKAGKNTGDGFEDGLSSTKPQIDSTSELIKYSTSDILGSTTDGDGGKLSGLLFDTGLGSTKGKSDSTSNSIKDSTASILGSTTDGGGGKKSGLLLDGGLGSTKGQSESTSTAINLAVSGILGRTTDGGGGLKSGSLFHQALSGQAGNASTAGKTVATSGKSGLGSVETSQEGTNFVTGFRNAMSAGNGSVWTTAWNLGKHALSALKLAIDSKSPAKETIKEGINFTDGFALAIDDGSKKVNKSATQMATGAVKELADGVSDRRKDAVKEVNRLFKEVRSEVSKASDTERAELKKNSDEIKKIDDEARKERSNAYVDSAKKRIETTQKTEESIQKIIETAASKKRKLTAAESRKITSIRKEAAETLQKIEEDYNKNIESINEKARNDKLNAEKEHTERLKKYKQISLADELKLYDEYIKRYKEGSEQRIYYEDKIAETKEAIHKRLISLNEEYTKKINDANQKLIDGEQKMLEDFEKRSTDIKEKSAQQELKINEEYSDKILRLKEDSLKEEQVLWDKYTVALKSREQSVYNSFGLFDQVKVSRVSGDRLIKNLETQTKALQGWKDDLTSLESRGIEEGLLEELQALGPDAAGEIKALTKLSDKELNQYTDLWREKSNLARTQSEKEMSGMKQDTIRQVAELRSETAKQLSIYQSEWNAALVKVRKEAATELNALQKEHDDGMKKLRKDTAEQLDLYQKEWTDAISNVRDGTKNEFNAMVEEMPAIGENVIKGMMDGLSNMSPALMAQAKSIADSVKSTIQSALDINSPSGVMDREVGHWIPAGIARGIEGNLGVVKDAMNKTAEAFKVKVADYKVDFGKTAFAIEENKQVLRVEHEIKDSGSNDILLEILKVLKRDKENERPANETNIHVITRDDDQIAREIARAQRRLIFQV